MGFQVAAAPVLTLADHPLAGRIWDVAQRKFVAEGEARERIARADIVLLGETHDNAAHHEIQLRVLRDLLERGKRPALALEQLDSENQAAVDAALAAGTGAADFEKAAKVVRGWTWSFYAPLVAVALEHRLPIIAANLSRPRAREVVGQGFAKLGEGEAQRLALAESWNAERGRAMRTLLVESHCGDDSPLIDRMVEMQRARDAVLADRIASAGERGAVAIVGRGHARIDLGVPLYLAQRFPRQRVISVGLVEVRENDSSPAEYSDASPGLHDLVWFTPRAVRDDPCNGLKGSGKAAPGR